jgi:hypothetical protein
MQGGAKVTSGIPSEGYDPNDIETINQKETGLSDPVLLESRLMEAAKLLKAAKTLIAIGSPPRMVPMKVIEQWADNVAKFNKRCDTLFEALSDYAYDQEVKNDCSD